VEKLIRAIASFTATALGAVLLVADGDACPKYGAFQGSASYSSDCTALTSGSGTLNLDVPAGLDDGSSMAAVKRQCEESGLHVFSAWIDYDSCPNGDEDVALPLALHLSFKSDGSQYVCELLRLPITGESTLGCAPLQQTAAPVSGAPSCTITFRPLSQ
jgi:hypothetical protein